jgi:hypothetical protein
VIYLYFERLQEWLQRRRGKKKSSRSEQAALTAEQH